MSPDASVAQWRPRMDEAPEQLDPLAAFLQQVEETPQITPDEEARALRRLHSAHRHYRRQVLGSGFSIDNAIEILQDVVNGELRVERSLIIEPAAEDVGEVLEKLRVTVATLQGLLESARASFARTLDHEVPDAQSRVHERDVRRQRRLAVDLLDRRLTSHKVRPMIELLQEWLRFGQRLEVDLGLSNAGANDLDLGRGSLLAFQVTALESLPALERRVRRIDLAYRRCDAARRELIQGHLRLVVSIARTSANSRERLFELIVNGNHGLARATMVPQVPAGQSFAEYAARFIRDEMKKPPELTWAQVTKHRPAQPGSGQSNA
jgi:RNA polymerase primary sigma factor